MLLSIRINQFRKLSTLLVCFLGASLLVLGLGCHRLYSSTFFNVPTLGQTSILIDQFGYRPTDKKIAVIVQSENSSGNSSDVILDKRLFDLYELISYGTEKVVYRSRAQIWNDGLTHEQSGDKAAWFDFTQIQEPGKYFIENARTGEKSAVFEISESVYRDALIHATRMFFYQRSGFPKHEPYADSRWTDDAAFLAPGQDTEARFVDDKENISLERDMRGGWFDAGDTNKYVTFAAQPIHQLLDAYTQNPSIWTDDFNIPESGNGIPDILDEILFEIEWLQRMQDSDGGVFIKIGVLDGNHAERPSLDRRPRYYGPKCSSSTIALSSIFARTSLELSKFPQLNNIANELRGQSEQAWQWFISHPLQTDCDSQEIRAGDADQPVEAQLGLSTSAAIYLFALTGNPLYDEYVVQNFQNTRPFHDIGWAVYDSVVGSALLDYTSLPNANVEAKNIILSSFEKTIREKQDIYGYDRAIELDPYLAYMPDDQYHWGSNQVKCNIGNTNYDVNLLRINSDNSMSYQERALSSLHYLHGVNPLGIVFLTNMYDYGVRQSANEMFHEWFGGGIYNNALTSPSGPAPGYLTGGPNKNYTGSAPLASLPPMKAYLDSNKGWDLNMWEITEPAIYYQSSYIKLLSKFIQSTNY